MCWTGYCFLASLSGTSKQFLLSSVRVRTCPKQGVVLIQLTYVVVIQLTQFSDIVYVVFL